MSHQLYKAFTCACGVQHTYPAYVFAYWVNEVKRTCACGRSYRVDPDGGVLLRT